MILQRAAVDELRHRALGASSTFSALVAVVAGLASFAWDRSAPVRAHVSTRVAEAGGRIPDVAPAAAVVTGLALVVVVLAAVGVTLAVARARTPR